MIRVSPFVKAMERACRERCRYAVYLGEVTVARPAMPYILVKLPAVNMGSGEALDGKLRELSYLQPLTVVAATADRLLTVLDDVRAALEGYELRVGDQYVEPLKLSYSSGMFRDDQVDLPEKGHPFYAVDMWQIKGVNRIN